jgi:hypothetical protein
MIELFVRKLRKTSRLALIAVGLLAACVPAATQSIEVPTQPPTEELENPLSDSATISTTPTAAVDLNLDKFAFVPLLPRDGIRPVYEPEFVEASDSPLHKDELVMGVAIQEEAKAYPVTVLRFREMVDDELGGLPILVTW